ncbi:uncharacterized protein G2W53_037633 [Senna tora]|uniref:Uncharacterized protein n=1 Tax=Senna tora TaxID=362788 RepID=A0A834SQN7_9FABA|nr:uncharacterized protein G2W53_037633 [Senna tora]
MDHALYGLSLTWKAEVGPTIMERIRYDL